MKAKLLVPVALLGVAPFSNALFTVTSFETGVFTPLNSSSKTTEQSTLNVTDGSFSMKINDKDGGWSMVYGSYGSDMYQQWFKNTKILLDVYFPARSGFQQVQIALAVNSDNGWKQKEVINWQWLNAGQDLRTTVEWDYSALVDPSKPTSSWIQFFILGAVPGKASSISYPLDVYVDNLRLDGAPVPEPMTMLAVGGGLLAVAIRRRRK